jgi:hypothetical protein
VRQQLLTCALQEYDGGHNYKKNPDVMTSPGTMGRPWRRLLTQEHTQTKQICCRGEQIGDIEIKGGALDVGKLATVVCQQTCGLSEAFGFHSKWNRQEIKKIGVSARKFWGMNPPKKRTFVFCA